MNFVIDFKREFNITDEDIKDLMSSVVYGINYWVKRVKPLNESIFNRTENLEEYVAEGGNLKLYVYEPFEEKDGKEVTSYILNIKSLIKGLQEWISQDCDRYGAIDYGRGTIDWGNVDAEMADMIVQFGLFGDVVYG